MTAKLTVEIEEERQRHAMALRIIADLHAAYGSGVELTIDATPKTTTWLYLSAPLGSYAAAFWDDGAVFDQSDGTSAVSPVAGGHLATLENVRTFLHEFGYGRR